MKPKTQVLERPKAGSLTVKVREREIPLPELFAERAGIAPGEVIEAVPVRIEPIAPVSPIDEPTRRTWRERIGYWD